MYFVHVNVLGCMLIVNLEKHTFLETGGFFDLHLHVECLTSFKLGDEDDC